MLALIIANVLSFVFIIFFIKNKTESLVIACVSYLRQQMTMDAELFQLSELKEYLVILTNKGFKQPTKDNVYVTKEYGNEVGLQENFPGKNNCHIFLKYFYSINPKNVAKRMYLHLVLNGYLVSL